MPRPPKGFDFTGAVRRICVDISLRLPEMGHVDMDRVAIGVCQTRNGAMHGVFAPLTPLRFAGGAAERKFRGRTMRIQPLVAPDGRDYL